jgi:hypothetical protein
MMGSKQRGGQPRQSEIVFQKP